MSEACQPTLSYGAATVKPGVPVGTMIVEISLRPACSPVTAVTVTKPVMSVPELVMNCFEPLITHSSPSSRAVVRVAPASEPASGSVRPKPAERPPGGEFGQQRAFCSSVPNRKIGIAPRLTPASSVIAMDWSTRAELLDREAQREVVAALPAVLLGERQAEQPELRHLRDERVGELTTRVVVPDHGRDDVLGEGLDGLAQRLVLLGQSQIHNNPLR